MDLQIKKPSGEDGIDVVLGFDVCRETFRRLSLQGKAPKPIRMGIRCTFYQNKELHRFLANPLEYRSEGI